MATYASNSAQAATLPSAGGRDDVAYAYSDPGDADCRANRAMHSATSSVQTVAPRYASHVPLPAVAKTSGTVSVAVHVGAMVEID